jgi:hypothetical protein
MTIAKIETFALRIPFKKGTKSDASAWSDRNSPAADSLPADASIWRHSAISTPKPS